MAYATQINTGTQSGLGARFAALFTNLRDQIVRRIAYFQTVRELRHLSDRELADLGLNQSIIRRVAYQAAYEA